MFGLEILVVLAVGGFGVAVWRSPALQQALRIRSSAAIDSSTTEIEKEQDEYNQLRKQIPAMQSNVADVMAQATMDARSVEAAQKKVADLQQKAKSPITQAASDDTKLKVARAYTEAGADLEACNARLAWSRKNADTAQKQFDTALTKLNGFSKQIERDKADNALADATMYSAKVKQQLNDFNDKVSGAGSASKKIAEKLAKADALDQLSNGSQQDQDLASLDSDIEAQKGLEALGLTLGNASKAAEKSAQ